MQGAFERGRRWGEVRKERLLSQRGSQRTAAASHCVGKACLPADYVKGFCAPFQQVLSSAAAAELQPRVQQIGPRAKSGPCFVAPLSQGRIMFKDVKILWNSNFSVYK